MFGQPLISGSQGRPARLSAFGERLLWAEKRILARLLPQAESLTGQLDRELLLAVDPALGVVPTAASHDLVFGALRERLLGDARMLLDVEYAQVVDEQRVFGDRVLAGPAIHPQIQQTLHLASSCSACWDIPANRRLFDVK